MRNLDVLEQEKQAIVQKMNDAIKKNDAKIFDYDYTVEVVHRWIWVG